MVEVSDFCSKNAEVHISLMSGPKTVRKIAAILGMKESDVSEILHYAKQDKTVLDTGRMEIKDMHDVFAGLENLRIYELNWFNVLSPTSKYA